MRKGDASASLLPCVEDHVGPEIARADENQLDHKTTVCLPWPVAAVALSMAVLQLPGASERYGKSLSILRALNLERRRIRTCRGFCLSDPDIFGWGSLVVV